MKQTSSLVQCAALAIALTVGCNPTELGTDAALFIPDEAYAIAARVPASIALICAPGMDRLSPGGMPWV